MNCLWLSLDVGGGGEGQIIKYVFLIEINLINVVVYLFQNKLSSEDLADKNYLSESIIIVAKKLINYCKETERFRNSHKYE